MLVHQGNEIDGIYDPDLERDYNEIDITRIRQVALLAGKGADPTVGRPEVGSHHTCPYLRISMGAPLSGIAWVTSIVARDRKFIYT